MPFGRPVPASSPLNHKFIVIKQIMVTEGMNNGGIFKVRNRETGRIRIEKRFKQSDVQAGAAWNEIRITAQLNHMNIVEYDDAYMQLAPYYRSSLYLGLCNHGSLDDILNNFYDSGRGVGEALMWSAFKHLTNALGYIHFGIQDTVHGSLHNPQWRTIVHRDISPKNIFLKTWPGHRFPLFLLGDFGCAMEYC